MIDIENDVFDYVAKALRAKHSGVSISGEYTETPASFPAVTLVEADNRIVSDFRSSERIENAVYVMYQLNVFSNKTKLKKEEAKALANTADAAMEELGFERDYREQIPNLNDATIYRIVCRYSGMVIPNDDGRYYIYSAQ